MKNYLKTNGVRAAILVAAVVLLIGLGAAAHGGNVGLLHNATGVLIAPVQKVVSSAVNLFDSIYGRLYKYDSLVAENESLRAQLADAQQSARDGVEASEENERLRQLLELRAKHTDYVFESAKIVLWSSSNWSHSFTISKGRNSGIELGDPVVTEYNEQSHVAVMGGDELVRRPDRQRQRGFFSCHESTCASLLLNFSGATYYIIKIILSQ